jgi:hypothetical protein
MFASPDASDLVRSRRGGKSPVVETIVSLAESVSIDRVKREIRCRIITEGRGNARDKHYYGPESVADIARLINGSKAFINHQTAAEEAQRPERDVWDQAGFWKAGTLGSGPFGDKGQNVTFVEAVLVCDNSPAGDEALAKAEAAVEYAKQFPGLIEVYAGISINGDGEIEEREINGETVNYVTTVTSLVSADVVTQPARGGKFLSLAEAVRNNPQGGPQIMNEALRTELQKFAAGIGAMLESKDDVKPADVLKLLTESSEGVKKAAGVTEADDEKKDEKSEEADDEKDDEKSDEADDDEDEKSDEADGDEKSDDEECDESGKKKPTGESKAGSRRGTKESAGERKYRKMYEAERKKNDSHASKRSLDKCMADLKEAGLEGKVSRKHLAAIPVEQRDAFVEMFKSIREAGGTGFMGTTVRGNGSGSDSKPGSSFLNTFRAGRA